MNFKFYTIILVYFTVSSYKVFSQANQKLSNLTAPTAINQHLQPGTANTLSLGQSGKAWRDLYIDNYIYIKGYRTILTPGSTNFFAGPRAGTSLVTGQYNTGIGYLSSINLYTGTYNTAGGAQSLMYTSTGSRNTAFGYNSLYANSNGYDNTGYGAHTLENNVSGHSNVALGKTAGYNNKGSGNTFAGAYAGTGNINGSYNTCIGYAADVYSTTGAYYYSTAIGYGSRITASNQVRIGDASTTSIGGYRPWSNFSDGRFKKNVEENVPGLAFINKLRPVTYNIKARELDNFLKKAGEGTDAGKAGEMNKLLNEQEKQVSTGFIAQEVEAAAKELGFSFDGVDIPKNETDLYGLRYAEFVVPLVKAVQELSKKVEELEALVERKNTSNSKAAVLGQNVPNPFNTDTKIEYALPSNSKNARLVVTDALGRMLKNIVINNNKGVVTLNTATLPSGSYNYSLIADGKVLATKKMIMTR